jgi:hypothetical protein
MLNIEKIESEIIKRLELLNRNKIILIDKVCGILEINKIKVMIKSAFSLPDPKVLKLIIINKDS